MVKFTVTPAAAKAVSTMEAADDLRLPLACGELADEEAAALRNFVNLFDAFDFFVLPGCVKTYEVKGREHGTALCGAVGGGGGCLE